MELQIIAFMILLISNAYGKLDDTFLSYDIVRDINIHTLSTRSVQERQHTKEVTFSAFGQNFTLELHPVTDLFAGDFKITVDYGNGHTSDISGLKKDKFLTGRVIGESDSRVSLHVDEDDVMTGVFTAHGEMFTLERLSNFADSEEMSDYDPATMVVYRKQDIKSDDSSHPKCGSIHPDDDDDDDESGHEGFEQIDMQLLNDDKAPSRKKRSSGLSRVCRIITVADYKYFNHMGGGDVIKTAVHMVNIINYVNGIYKNTGFSVGSGYGFEISLMYIHTAASTGADATTYPYNVAKTWGNTELLEAFGRATVFSGFCLNKLFTANQMADGVLGLAYIASSKVGSAGGICSPTRTSNGVTKMYNTAWSSSRNGAGSTVTFLQQALVCAHEFGHNLGSEHDPSTDNCSPGTFLDDGKYLMYAYAVNGEDPNNDKLSPCSIQSISSVLSNKAGSCFVAASIETTCGNGRLDAGEECDGGLLSKFGIDECCEQTCTLKTGAVCSPMNKACCRQCQVAAAGYVCRGDNEGSCSKEAQCDGVSLECPAAENKNDGISCLDQGFCLQGNCTPFCVYNGQQSCLCENLEDSCKRCCRDSSNRCQVYDASLFLADGRTCIQGYCQSGSCQKVETDLVARLWDFIDNISFDYIIESFKTNMVACVTGFSLVLYTPLCIVIWCIDKKRKKDWEHENSVHIRTDRGLAHDEDKRPIGNPNGSRSKPATLDASELMHSNNYGRPNSRNRIQPLGSKPASSHA